MFPGPLAAVDDAVKGAQEIGEAARGEFEAFVGRGDGDGADVEKMKRHGVGIGANGGIEKLAVADVEAGRRGPDFEGSECAFHVDTAGIQELGLNFDALAAPGAGIDKLCDEGPFTLFDHFTRQGRGRVAGRKGFFSGTAREEEGGGTEEDGRSQVSHGGHHSKLRSSMVCVALFSAAERRINSAVFLAKKEGCGHQVFGIVKASIVSNFVKERSLRPPAQGGCVAVVSWWRGVA